MKLGVTDEPGAVADEDVDPVVADSGTPVVEDLDLDDAEVMHASFVNNGTAQAPRGSPAFSRRTWVALLLLAGAFVRACRHA